MNQLINLFKKILTRLNSYGRAAATVVRKRTGKADYQRWSRPLSLALVWDDRTKLIANLIPPGSRIIEFGAGRLVLKDHLPENCTYTPSDLVDRGRGTIVCDLNSGSLPSLEPYNVAVFSGVLEYVNDVPRLVNCLAAHMNTVVASYAISDTNISKRRAEGWVNDYSSDELLSVFKVAGFSPDRMLRWEKQEIYLFVKYEHA
jgi:hypothetical protein